MNLRLMTNSGNYHPNNPPTHTHQKKKIFCVFMEHYLENKREKTQRKDFKTIVVWDDIKTSVSLGNDDYGSERPHIFI